MKSYVPEHLQKKLRTFLDRVQHEDESELYIYGISNAHHRSLWQRLDDFFIDRSSVPLTEKSYFMNLLSTMLGSGISLNAGLKMLAAKSTHPRLKRIIATMSYEIEHGRQLSVAAERFPDVFSGAERGAIRSAEATGNLEQILRTTADAIDRRIILIMSLKSALIYPIAVLLTLVVGFATMLVWVVPKIEEVFTASQLPLPIATKILIAVSNAVTSGWWIAIALLLLAISGVLLYTSSPDGKFSWDFGKLRLPIVGPLLRKLSVLRFVDSLGMLIESGVAITNALELTAESVGNEIYRIKTYDALAQITDGIPLSQSLSEAPFLFPTTVSNMIAVAEQSASIGDIAHKIALQYDREISYSLRNITTTLGPVLIIITGIGVGLFALAVLSPIFSLTQSL